jgi:hypothetical protein
MYIGLHVTHPSFLSCLMQLELSQQISKNTKISNLMKIRAVGEELFVVERRTHGQT